jgi:hypothetical protein
MFQHEVGTQKCFSLYIIWIQLAGFDMNQILMGISSVDLFAVLLW